MYDLQMKSYCQGFLDYIERIDVQSYEDPWSADKLHKLGRNIRVCTMEDTDEVLGFYLVDIENDTGRILKFAVKPSWRRKGIGTVMFDDLLQEAFELKRVTLLLHERDVDAQLFAKEMHFRWKKTIKGGEVAGQTEDLYLMMRATSLLPEERLQCKRRY